jgi:hypothetical protein
MQMLAQDIQRSAVAKGALTLVSFRLLVDLSIAVD